ncbi:MAG: hypothetical protein ABIH99_01830, partial [Candidatus Micrarchaeota archaeon]
VTETNKLNNEPTINSSAFTLNAYDSGTGAYSFKNNTAVEDTSSYKVTVSFTDDADNSNTSGVRTFKVDNTAPSVAVSAPSESAVVRTVSGYLWVNGTVTETNKLDNEPTINSTAFTLNAYDSGTGVYSFKNNTEIADTSAYIVTVSFVDDAGNSGTSSAKTFEIDNLLPVIAIDAPSEGGIVRTVSGYLWVNGTITETNKLDNGPSINASAFTLNAYDSGTGAYSFKNNTAVADSTEYKVTVSFMDDAGNVNESDVRTFKIDNTAPSIAVSAPSEGSAVRVVSGFIWVNGTITDLHKSNNEPTINSTNFTLNAYDSGTGAYSFKNNTPLGDTESYEVVVSFVDDAGNSGSSSTLTFDIDNYAPSVAVSAPSEGASVRAVSGFIWINGTVTETNKANNNPTINSTNFTLNNYNSGTGAYSFKNNTPLGDTESYEVVVSFVDDAGNSGSSSTRTFDIDNYAPSVAVSAPSDSAVVRTISGYLWVNGTVTETNKLNNEPTINSTAFTLNAYDSGTGAYSFKNNSAVVDTSAYIVTVSFVDDAGNSGTSSAKTFGVDNTAPNITIAYPGENVTKRTVSGYLWVNGTVSDSNKLNNNPSINSSAFTLNNYNSGTGAYSFKNNTAVADVNGYEVTVSFVDDAGNSNTSSVRSFNINNTNWAPVVNITSPEELQIVTTIAGYLWVNGTIDDDNRVSNNPEINSSEFALNAYDSGTGVYSFKNNTAVADSSSYSVVVNFTDDAGAPANSSTRLFKIDNTVPAVVITAPNASANLSGITALNATVTDAIAGVNSSLVFYWITNESGNVSAWSALSNASASEFNASFNASAFANGWYNITVNASDVLGFVNASESVRVNISTRTIAPSGPVISHRDDESHPLSLNVESTCVNQPISVKASSVGGVVSGVTVDLLYHDGFSWTNIGSASTSSRGLAVFTPTRAGRYEARATGYGYFAASAQFSIANCSTAFECTSDAQCGANKTCVNNVCVTGVVIAPECVNYSGCGEWEVCSSGVCVEKQKECLTSDACAEDKRCSNFTCVAVECAECEYVLEHGCAAYECCKNEDCEAGNICVNNACQAVNVNKTIEKMQAKDDIESAKRAIEKALNEGTAPSAEVQKLVEEADNAYVEGNYTYAMQLAKKAKELTANATASEEELPPEEKERKAAGEIMAWAVAALLIAGGFAIGVVYLLFKKAPAGKNENGKKKK